MRVATKQIFFIAFTTILGFNFLNAQITIGDIEFTEIKTVQKPNPYDSLINFNYQENISEYNKYVGLQVYLPSTSNPDLFSVRPSFLKIDSARGLNLYYIVPGTDGFGNSTSKQKRYDSLVTYVYKPMHFSSNNMNGSQIAGIASSGTTSEKYYTILNVFPLDSIRRIMFNDLRFEAGKKRKHPIFVDEQSVNDLGNEYSGQRELGAIFLLRNDSTGDSTYCSDLDKFILVPYFVKQKELYQNQQLVNVGSNIESIDFSTGRSIIIKKGDKWLCGSVTLLQKNIAYPKNESYVNDFSYGIFYILKNDSGQSIVLENLGDGEFYAFHFITFNEFIKQENERKMSQQALIAKQKQDESIRKEDERKLAEKRRSYCVIKFGEHYGALIAQGKVEIGMTLEMCREAWGTPFQTYKTTKASGTNEQWCYGWKYNLFFENGILVKIEN